jgi:hypothetical protein
MPAHNKLYFLLNELWEHRTIQFPVRRTKRILIEMLTVAQAMKFSSFYERLILMYSRERNWSCNELDKYSQHRHKFGSSRVSDLFNRSVFYRGVNSLRRFILAMGKSLYCGRTNESDRNDLEASSLVLYTFI